jgi:hypothetical protein
MHTAALTRNRCKYGRPASAAPGNSTGRATPGTHAATDTARYSSRPQCRQSPVPCKPTSMNTSEAGGHTSEKCA